MTQPDYQRMIEKLPMGRDAASVRRRIEAMEVLLERAVAVPLLGRRIGLDSVLGLVPVVGDIVTAVMGTWLIWEARNLGMSRFQLLRMAGNIAFDTALGAVPLAGDLFDFLFRSNSRNLRLIRRHLDKHHPEAAMIEGEVVRREDP